jgi:hypothetical protein
MSDDTPRDTPSDETQPVRPSGGTLPPAPAAGPATDPAPAAATGRRGLRERLRTWRTSNDGGRAYSLGALIASALAGVIVGGLGLAAVQAVADDHGDRPGWMERHGPMGRDFGDDDGDGGPGFGPGRMPGQLQPTTPPEDDDSSSS